MALFGIISVDTNHPNQVSLGYGDEANQANTIMYKSCWRDSDQVMPIRSKRWINIKNNKYKSKY